MSQSLVVYSILKLNLIDKFLKYLSILKLSSIKKFINYLQYFKAQFYLKLFKITRDQVKPYLKTIDLVHYHFKPYLYCYNLVKVDMKIFQTAFKNQPKYPPSVAQAKYRQMTQKEGKNGSLSNVSENISYGSSLKALLVDVPSVLLIISYGKLYKHSNLIFLNCS